MTIGKADGSICLLRSLKLPDQQTMYYVYGIAIASFFRSSEVVIKQGIRQNLPTRFFTLFGTVSLRGERFTGEPDALLLDWKFHRGAEGLKVSHECLVLPEEARTHQIRRKMLTQPSLLSVHESGYCRSASGA